MPEPSTFDIQTPSGHVLSIEAPDQETALAGARQWHEENTSLLGQATDFAKSTPTGIATVGIPGILGGPGDVRKGLSSATDIISGNLGIDPAKTEQFKNTFYNASKLNPVLAPFTQPGSQEIKSVLEQNVINPTIGPMHQPQNEGGELGLKFGGMLPYMVAAGSKIPSAIIGALTGAAGSEAGKHIAEGTPYEGTAEIAGGVVGPYAATKTAELGLKGLGKIVGGITSGAGENVPQQAFQAGVAGGKPWETFTQNMRKQVPPEEIVNQANGAIDNLIRSKNANYEAGVAKLDQTPHFVGFSGAEKGLADTADIGNIRGVVTNQGAQSARDEITSLVNKWKGMSQQEPAIASERGIHDLKRAVGQIRDKYEGVEGKGAEYAIANSVYHNIQNSISKVSTLYEKMTSDYASAMNELTQLKKTFSLKGPDTNIDTALRKLQSITRDNANTNYGQRTKLASVLEQHGAPNLGTAAAGQASQAWLPRGLSRLASGLEGAGIGTAGALLHPGALAALPVMAAASSPRIAGETAGYAGRLAGMLGLPEAFQATQGKGQMAKNLAALLLMKNSQAQQNPALSASLLGQGI